MILFWFILYNISLPLFRAVLSVISLFNSKVSQSLSARKSLFADLESKLVKLDGNRKNILFECSSLGEFEEAKPIIEELDKTNKYNFVIAFFSPSGFNNARLDFDINGIIVKTYLPLDSLRNVKLFLRMINPEAVVLIKYDLWFNFLYTLNRLNIRTILVNASLTVHNLKWRFFISRSFYKTLLKFFDAIITKDEDDARALKMLLRDGVNVRSFGDTKLERIQKARERSVSKNLIDGTILKGKKVIVVGSSWEKDETILFPVLERFSSNGHSDKFDILTILAPHEPTTENLQQIESHLKLSFPRLRYIRFSNLDNYSGENLIIVDSIGQLLTLYKYADVAYVGGGLETGLHNVLEPAGYGVPVLFGNEKMSDDAEMLINTGGGITVNNTESLYKHFTWLLNETQLRKKLGDKAASVFAERTNSSKKIAELIQS